MTMKIRAQNIPGSYIKKGPIPNGQTNKIHHSTDKPLWLRP